MLNTVSIIKQIKCITSAPIIIQLKKDVDSFKGLSQFWLLNVNINKCKGMRTQIFC